MGDINRFIPNIGSSAKGGIFTDLFQTKEDVPSGDIYRSIPNKGRRAKWGYLQIYSKQRK